MKKAGAGIQSGSSTELAFTRALSAATSGGEHDHAGHAHGSACVCGAMTRIANIIASGEVPSAH